MRHNCLYISQESDEGKEVHKSFDIALQTRESGGFKKNRFLVVEQRAYESRLDS
jgi:hypothetical protein